MYNRFILFAAFIILSIYNSGISAENIITVSPASGSDNSNLSEALEKASKYNGKPVTISLKPGIYDFSRAESSEKIYYVSNTTSEEENPEPLKHIALLLEGMKNVTIDGCGSTLLMTGEMTSFVFDKCKNIVFKNINIDNSNPTQTEMTVRENGKDYLIAEVHPTSKYRIEQDRLVWYGDGWSFSGGIAQSYDYVSDMTWRSWSPMTGLVKTVEIEPNLLYLKYSKKPEVKVGTVFQMRDAIRDEVCGFVNRSANVRFENVNFYYLGNFGVVSQYSEDVTFSGCNFMPKPGSGRTNAGFADFIQVSGCKGKINIEGCAFAGAHDDPINVHGTHLKVVDFMDARTLRIRFMHPQTYGFEAFFKGDLAELVNAETLLSVLPCKIVDAELLSPREMVIKLDRNIPADVREVKNLVVENVTWTPEVNITGNKFSRIPTRGVLLSTRRKSLIENNVFYGMQMSAILVADDAMSWYESGPVHDLTIRRNTFIQCGGPVIFISPENKKYEGAVHRNIVIEENVFESDNPSVQAISVKGVDGLVVKDNMFRMKNENNLILKDVLNVTEDVK